MIGLTLVQDGIEEAEHDLRVSASDNLEDDLEDEPQS
jgi:hypothetical protein